MRGKQFIAVAEHLACGESEAHWRTAVSRAYYAAFHTAREAIVQHVRLSGGSNEHGQVPNCLSNSGDTRLAEQATKLNTLHTQRIRADYHLTDPSVKIGQRNAGVWIMAAKECIEAIEASPLMTGDLGPVVKAITQYLHVIN